MPEGLAWAAAFVAAFAVTAGAAPPLLDLLRRRGALAPAFDGRPLPRAGGLAPVLGAAAGLALAPEAPGVRAAATALLGAALWGLLDDLLPDADARGWRAHLGALARGRWSCGAAKALGVAAAGAAATGSAVGALAVALTANLVNVVDCRPGRAAKAWVAGALALAAAGGAEAAALVPLWGAVLAWWPRDATRQAMLGDTGANALGAALGAVAAVALPSVALGAWLAAAAALQLLADRVSLSRWIDRRPLARRLDRLGMPPDGGTAGPSPK